MKKITFVIPSRNNLEFLQLAYKSIKNLEGEHEILVLNDASVDGTQKWLDSFDDDDLIVYTNPGPDRIGIVGMFDKGIEMATTDIICAFHADMVAGKNLDKNILKHLERGRVVCATRVEPPLHPQGPEKHIQDFGNTPNEFDLNSWYNTDLEQNTFTRGVFAPWCMYKEDFLSIGGHDELFAPQSREDSDLFNRFVLNGYQLIQSWDAIVYHFTSRGSRFNKYSGGDIGKDSPEWKETNSKNEKNFYRKWGTHVQHDRYMHPIVTPKYDIGFVVKMHGNTEMLQHLEPLCSTLYVDCDFDEYIKKEQPNTLYDLSEKIHSIHSEKNNDIIVRFDLNEVNDQSYRFLQQLSEIIFDSGEIGNMSFDCFEIDIIKLNNCNNTHINLTEDNKIVRSLWIGDELSNLEQLCIRSFIENGHEFHLYTYGDVKGIPNGTVVKDGNEILPESDIFFYKTADHYGSYSAFSNWFRYKMLMDKGGYWSDMDTICISPLNFKESYVFSSEYTGEGHKHINAGVIKSPKGSEFIKYCWDKTQEIGKEVRWGQIGPRLVKESVEKHKLTEYVKDPEVFCPTHYENMDVFIGKESLDIHPSCKAIHFWNESWRKTGLDKNGDYDEKSLFEILKKRYHVGR